MVEHYRRKFAASYSTNGWLRFAVVIAIFAVSVFFGLIAVKMEPQWMGSISCFCFVLALAYFITWLTSPYDR